ncbi:MAG: hypothetical protein E6Q97_29180 [Desulfurellales bacterium]|nr:MAG: hypothetical protein E6Q97_29180 [Desulfurellales bacterium]
MINPVRRAVNYVGGVSKMARALNIQRASVYKWIDNGYVPADRAIPVERLVDGKVTRHELCPSIYPDEAA